MKNLSLNAKIWCVIALLAASYLVTTGVGLSQLVTVRDRLNEVTGPITKSDNLTAEIESQQRLLSIYTLQSLVMTKEEELKENMAGYRKIGDTLRAKLDELDAIASPKEKEAIREYRATFEEFSKTWDRVNALSSTNKAEAVALFLEARPRLVGALNKKLEQMNAITRASRFSRAWASRGSSCARSTARSRR